MASATYNFGMRRFLSMLAVFASVAAFGALAFTADGSALLMPTTVTLMATGPSPSTVKMGAAESVLAFVNDDSVSHRVVFANGHCSLDVAPGNDSGSIQSGVNACPYPLYVGTYTYTVDGRFPGSVRVTALSRSVTLTAPAHTVRRGSQLTLHGELTFAPTGGEPAPKPPFPVIVLARGEQQRAFHRIATVSARLGRGGQFVWHFRVRPGVRTTYVAELKGQRRIWKEARSGSFTVRIRR